MSTNDVPGADPKNRDTLHMGCWAEHLDGSLVFVESTEAGRVIYYMFDLKNMTQYRDAMPEVSFKRTFSWDPKNPKSEKWTWHDKTVFPWDKVIKEGFRDGQDFPSADHLMNAAEKVAASRRRHRNLLSDDLADDESVDEGNRSTAASRVARALHLQADALQKSAWEDRIDRTMNKVAGAFAGFTDALNKLSPGRSSKDKGRGARR